ncbi:hypothetical protein Acsp03_01310 [Actinomadura sp. NBRC 104412]|nr:hypothetical protein Acsp03_01310 [Actinomadura sp. NBRC 104412]
MTLDLIKWHLDRYDRLRASTATRASVVLSAGAILSAGNAVILSQILNVPRERLGPEAAPVFGIGLLASVSLVVLSVVHASGVLVALKGSRDLFPDAGTMPTGLFFNGSDTVARLSTFQQFQAAMAAQDQAGRVEAAQVELWIVIRQHRRRYRRLRASVRALRWAAIVFLAALTGLVITVLLNAL